MPFTLSHAAAALPFRRTRLVQSALVVGCFAPDFEYFLGHHGAFGHTLPGAFVFDLPLAFAVLWLFHHYAKEPLVACLPRGMRERLEPGPRSLSIRSVSHFASITFSILVGIATHLLWDSFTHPRFWVYQHWHFLHETVNLPWFGTRPWFGILQYLSSVFGLVVILLWCVHWYRNTQPIHADPFEQRPVSLSRIVLACAFAAAMMAGFLRAAVSGIPDGISGSQRFATQAIITLIPVLWIEIVVYGIIWNATQARVDDRATQVR